MQRTSILTSPLIIGIKVKKFRLYTLEKPRNPTSLINFHLQNAIGSNSGSSIQVNDMPSSLTFRLLLCLFWCIFGMVLSPWGYTDVFPFPLLSCTLLKDARKWLFLLALKSISILSFAFRLGGKKKPSIMESLWRDGKQPHRQASRVSSGFPLPKPQTPQRCWWALLFWAFKSPLINERKPNRQGRGSALHGAHHALPQLLRCNLNRPIRGFCVSLHITKLEGGLIQVHTLLIIRGGTLVGRFRFCLPGNKI